MNRQETLEWIEVILDSLDHHEMMAIIQEAIGQFDGDFFDTISSEIERYKNEENISRTGRLEQIARTIASIRQNRVENL
jgi:hypothetical protein